MTETLSTPTPAPPPVAPEPSGGGFFQNLVDLYFAPREAFTRIVRKPAFLLPLLGQLVLVIAFTGIWLNKVDPQEFMKAQLEQSGQMEKLQPEQREAVMKMAPMQLKIGGAIGVVFTPLMLLVVGAVLMFIYRFFYAGEVAYKQALAIVAWTFFAVGVVTTPLMLLVFQLKGDWNLNPQELLQANLGLLLDKATAAKPLFALLSSIDLFTLWVVFLLASGFAVACRKTTGQAIWGVAVPWALIVLIKVAWAAIF
jgi:hypothetical protein